MQVLKQEMKPTLVHGIYLTWDQHLRGRLIGWLRIRRPWTGFAAGGRLTSLEPCQKGIGITG
jgi:hypothetical protein